MGPSRHRGSNVTYHGQDYGDRQYQGGNQNHHGGWPHHATGVWNDGYRHQHHNSWQQNAPQQPWQAGVQGPNSHSKESPVIRRPDSSRRTSLPFNTPIPGTGVSKLGNWPSAAAKTGPVPYKRHHQQAMDPGSYSAPLVQSNQLYKTQGISRAAAKSGRPMPQLASWDSYGMDLVSQTPPESRPMATGKQQQQQDQQQQREQRGQQPKQPQPPQQQQQQQQQQQKQGCAADDLYQPLTWATQQVSPHGPIYTQLSREMAEWVNANQPNPVDLAQRQAIIKIVEDTALCALPEYSRTLQVKPFGSFVTGLGTGSSDLDVVIVGVTQPAHNQPFYASHERNSVARLLDMVGRSLRKSCLRVYSLLVIRHARIPICKAKVGIQEGFKRIKGSSLPPGINMHDIINAPPVELDISLVTDSGPQAACHLATQSKRWPALRPLSLTLKRFFQSVGLNDVKSGGLSSYGLIYMTLAHLMAEESAGQHDEGTLLDLGWLLHGFFVRYGREFDADKHYVAVGRGGIVSRAHAGSREGRICCIDPLTGLDVTEGCFQSADVIAAIRCAANFLDRVVNQYSNKPLPTHPCIMDSLIEHCQHSHHFDDDDDHDHDDDEHWGGAGFDDGGYNDAYGDDHPQTVKRRPLASPPIKKFAYTYPSVGEQAGTQDVPVPIHMPKPVATINLPNTCLTPSITDTHPSSSDVSTPRPVAGVVQSIAPHQAAQPLPHIQPDRRHQSQPLPQGARPVARGKMPKPTAQSQGSRRASQGQGSRRTSQGQG